MGGTTSIAISASPAPPNAKLRILPGASSDRIAPAGYPDAFREPLSVWDAPAELDLSDACSLALLGELDARWSALPRRVQSVCLRETQFTVSVTAPDAADIILLPGGLVAMGGPEGVRVPDPVSVAIFSAAEAQVLRRALQRSRSAVTLMHLPQGIVSVEGVPAVLAPQSATLLAQTPRLPKCAGITGPVLIHWGISGATLWSMGAAPPLVNVAVRAAGLRVAHGSPALPSELWAAAGSAARCDLIAPGVSEIVGDLLAGLISDELQHAIMDRCINGMGSLAGSIAQLLAGLPASFQADQSRWRGELPMDWHNAAHLLREAGPGRAVLGLEDVTDAHRAVVALRHLFHDSDTALFLETGVDALCATVPVDCDSALFLVRRAGAQGRAGVLIDCDGLAPTDLYAIANGLAGSAGATVTVAAPDWGLCHRVTRDQQEAGNAAWFGMGAGLDELEIFAD